MLSAFRPSSPLANVSSRGLKRRFTSPPASPAPSERPSSPSGGRAWRKKAKLLRGNELSSSNTVDLTSYMSPLNREDAMGEDSMMVDDEDCISHGVRAGEEKNCLPTLSVYPPLNSSSTSLLGGSLEVSAPTTNLITPAPTGGLSSFRTLMIPSHVPPSECLPPVSAPVNGKYIYDSTNGGVVFVPNSTNDMTIDGDSQGVQVDQVAQGYYGVGDVKQAREQYYYDDRESWSGGCALRFH